MRHLQRTVAVFGALGVAFFGTAHLSAGVFPYPVCSVDDPVAGATGDFNGDGAPDLVTVSDSLDHISILLNQGDGTLGEETLFATGEGPRDVAVGDLDGDGALDVIAAIEDGFGISVLLGNGDGTFGAFTNYSAGQHPAGLAVADFSGDGVLDVAVAVEGMDSLAVLLGHGDGSFGGATLYTSMNAPLDVEAVDVDLDGVLDLVAANSTTDSISVFLGQGDGTFINSPQYYAAIPFAETLTVGHFNGDNAPDLVVTGRRWYHAVLLNNGDGTFAYPVDYDGLAQQVLATDLNGDGFDDLVGPGASVVDISLAVGDGTFEPYVSFGILNLPSWFALADMDGDGAVDLSILSMLSVFGHYHGAATVVLGNGDGTLDMPPLHDAGEEACYLRASDLNDDGIVDLVVSNSADGGAISVLMGQGDAVFAAPVSYPIGTHTDGAAIGDLNNDGILDLVTTSVSSDTVIVLLGVGDGTFHPATTFGIDENPARAAIGDVDNDGNADLVLRTEDENARFHLTVLLGAGDGTFAAPQRYHRSHAMCWSIKLADLNNDGFLDVTCVLDESDYVSNDGIVYTYLNNGDGTYPAPDIFDPGANLENVELHDFNHDGVLDMAVGTLWSTPRYVYIRLGEGDGTFEPAVGYGSGYSEGGGISVADFDGDGELDIAANVGFLAILPGQGDGTFGEPVHTYFGGTLTADFNQDGGPDLASLTPAGVRILLNPSVVDCPGDLDGDLDVDQADLGILLASYGNDAGGDIDGDGDTDQADLGALLGNYDGDC